jgi:hypothetical protein
LQVALGFAIITLSDGFFAHTNINSYIRVACSCDGSTSDTPNLLKSMTFL